MSPFAKAVPTLDVAVRGRPFRALDLRSIAARTGTDLDAMPYVIRVLFENLWRHRLWSGEDAVGDPELGAIGHWAEHVGSELPLHVARVILPDSSGAPVLQDLAALRLRAGDRHKRRG